MAEDTEFTPYDPEAETVEEPPAEEERPRRSLWGLLALVSVIVVIILLLLMLRGCGGAGDEIKAEDLKSIEPVAHYEAQAGLISIWVEDPKRLPDILANAGLSDVETIDMQGGKFVIVVPQGSEKETAEKLMRLEGVYDAGLVYTKGDKD